MMKMILMGAIALTLASCGRYDFRSVGSFGADANEAGTFAKVVKTIKFDKDTNSNKVSHVSTDGKSITFTFSSRPGSQGGYLTGYKVVRDSINGKDLTSEPVTTALKTNVYIPPGYICPNPIGTQACSINDTNAVPGNAFADKTLLIDFSSGLIPKAISEDGAQSRSFDITFVGYSSTYEPIEVPLTRVVGGVNFEVVSN